MCPTLKITKLQFLFKIKRSDDYYALFLRMVSIFDDYYESLVYLVFVLVPVVLIEEELDTHNPYLEVSYPSYQTRN